MHLEARFEAERVLVVAAHPDDEVLGPGGTLKRLADQGARVRIVIACRGRPGYEDVVEECAHRAGVVLGAEEVLLWRLPNLRLDTLPLIELVRRIEAVSADFRPTIILTHHGGDLNRDHQACFEATVVALRPLPRSTVRALLCFETPSSTEWAGERLAAFQPNVFVDITRVHKAKLEALRLYQVELRPHPHPRSLRSVTALARARGAGVGVPLAEAFRLVRGMWR